MTNNPTPLAGVVRGILHNSKSLNAVVQNPASQ